MAQAPLRPVPTRPAGPVDPDAAVRHVAAALPALDADAAAALALVALAGRSRAAAAATIELEPAEVGGALARARKELRRALMPLPGTGWCERAERLVSDRLDDALEPPGPARLEAHLRNCPRCVEHERRLVQATDVLVAGFEAATPGPAAEPPSHQEAPARPARALRVVRRSEGPAVRPFGEPVQPAPRRPRPVPASPPVAAPPPTPAAAPFPDPGPARQPLPLPRRDEPVGAPVAAAPRRERRSLAGFAWAALFALAVLLAVASLAITIVGVLGG